jgi:CubicO group peptidase (beta-lactamase class C family)
MFALKLKHLHWILIYSTLTYFSCGQAATLSKQEFGSKVDQIFSSVDKPDAPGCAVGVIENGGFLYKSAYGMANLELNVPLSADSVFRIASISKQFTAMAVLILAQQNKIDLDADIHTYLTDLPKYQYKVTVRAILGHFSGMSNYEHIAASYEGEKLQSDVDLRSPFGRPFQLGLDDFLNIEEFYQAVKLLPLKHQPDTKFEYNNVAYFLLSKLVEKQSKQTLRQFAQENIFKPLNMQHSFFSDDKTEIVKNRAYGYAPKEGGGFINHMTNLFWVGDGGVHTSINDFIKWDQNFYHPTLSDHPVELRDLMNTPSSDHTFGNDFHYAYGQMKGKVMWHNAYFHSGGWVGFSTNYLRIEEDNFSVVALCNNEELSLNEYFSKVMRLYFDEYKKN